MATGDEPNKTENPGSAIHELGEWSLGFDPGGTLIELSHRGGPRWLHRSIYEFDLKDGRIFHPRGWDECFPSIDAHGQSGVMGRLIGNAPVLRVTKESITQEWLCPDMTASRTFSSRAEQALLVSFEAKNTGALPMEYLWASHALFSVDGLLRVHLAHNRVLDDFSLDHSCGKFFVASSEPAILEREESVLTITTDQPFWGVWLNRGGWPADVPAGFCCIGIEATNCDAETPQGAVLRANEIFRGYVMLRIEPRRS